MMKKCFRKNLCFIIILSLSLLMTSCDTFRNKYNPDDILANMSNYFFDSNADGVAKNIVLPDKDNDRVLTLKYGVDSYFIGPVDIKDSDKTFYKKPYKRVPMASLTKLMTALIVLKYQKDLDATYVVSAEAVDLSEHDSKADLQEGDVVSVRDLLYGLLIPSGNDCANVLAENLDENVDNFLIMMNNEAERIGCLNTHFSNPNGLDDEYHFTSAYDVYIIISHLLKYKIFSDISGLTEYSTDILQKDGTTRHVTWKSTNGFFNGGYILSDKADIIASKTGTTTNAGYCIAIVSKSKVNNKDYISVVMHATQKLGLYNTVNILINNTH